MSPRCHLPIIAGRVAAGLEDLGDRDLVGVQAVARAGVEHVARRRRWAFPWGCGRGSTRCGWQPVSRPARVGVQTGAAAYQSVKRMPSAAMRSIRGVLICARAVAAEVGVALVVGQDDDDVRRGRPHGRCDQANEHGTRQRTNQGHAHLAMNGRNTRRGGPIGPPRRSVPDRTITSRLRLVEAPSRVAEVESAPPTGRCRGLRRCPSARSSAGGPWHGTRRRGRRRGGR